jgi:hypothetical protein
MKWMIRKISHLFLHDWGMWSNHDELGLQLKSCRYCNKQKIRSALL